jgi:NAD(P)H-hydrate repair Nnr-like enzyme with NAD(P)H-hydrate dehydratase domain
MVGGHRHGFRELQAVYEAAVDAGVGSCTVAMPDSLKPLAGELADAVWLPSTASGSIARPAAAAVLEQARLADAVIIGPNLSQNAETTLMAETVLREVSKPIIFVEDGLRLFNGQHKGLVVASMTEVFSLADRLQIVLNLNTSDRMRRAAIVSQMAAALPGVDLVVLDHDIIVDSGDQVSLTALPSPTEAGAAGVLATFWTQHPTKHFEVLSTAAFVIKRSQETGQGIAGVLDNFS